MIGDRYGQLVVIGVGEPKENDPRKRKFWICLCDCGKQIKKRTDHLRGNKNNSCGCYRPKRAPSKKRIHGGHENKAYGIYCGIKARCRNKNVTHYDKYGGRGIKICDRWLYGENGKHGFHCFIEDMGERPSPQHSVERRDVNGDYCPENCYWLPQNLQQRNTRANKNIEFKGQAMCLSAWAEEIGIPYSTLRGRLRRGWNIERALTV